MELTFLNILWFILIAVLWIGYLTLEGFDFGVGMLLRILPANETERRQAITTIGPHWDGNEVWLLTAGGATFAAFPYWYSTMFAGMYLALFLILLCLIVRVCALEWRSKINTKKWRNIWDWVHTVSAWIPSILWGVAFANLLQGMQIRTTQNSTGATVHVIEGGLLGIITPFTLLGGLVTASLFLTHGATYLALRVKGDLQKNAMNIAKPLSLVSLVLSAAFVLWTQFAFSRTLITLIPLIVAALILLGVVFATHKQRDGLAFGINFGAIATAVVFIFGVCFPYALKSAININDSLTLADAAATPVTQTIMTVVAVIFVPVVLAYTVWSYWVFSKRVSAEDLSSVPGLDPAKIREFFHR